MFFLTVVGGLRSIHCNFNYRVTHLHESPQHNNSLCPTFNKKKNCERRWEDFRRTVTWLLKVVTVLKFKRRHCNLLWQVGKETWKISSVVTFFDFENQTKHLLYFSTIFNSITDFSYIKVCWHDYITLTPTFSILYSKYMYMILTSDIYWNKLSVYRNIMKAIWFTIERLRLCNTLWGSQTEGQFNISSCCYKQLIILQF